MTNTISQAALIFVLGRTRLPHLVSYVNNPIRYDQTQGRENYTVYGVERLEAVFSGIGLIYFWVNRASEYISLSNAFVMKRSVPIDFDEKEPDRVTVSFPPSNRFPCSGVIAQTGEGYIFAPCLKLSVSFGRDTMLLLISPSTTPRGITVHKQILAVSNEEATVTLSNGNGELRCIGSISGSFKESRIILNRNPGLPVYKNGFDETLAELKQPGGISAVWKPVSRSFEEQLVVFHPSNAFGTGSMGSYFFPSEVLSNIGVPEDIETANSSDYVIGDGVGVDYTIRLVVDRGLGRHSTDEAKLTVM